MATDSRPLEPQVGRPTGRTSHPQHGLRYRDPGLVPLATIAAWTFGTVRTPSPLPTASAINVPTTSSRQLRTALCVNTCGEPDRAADSLNREGEETSPQ